MSAPIVITEYDPRWTQEFQTIRSRIAESLGPLASAIEHVGSTAVPGLAAKPIIDLDVLLRSDAYLVQAINILSSLGYRHQGDLGVSGREAFRSPPDDFPHHLYVCSPTSQEYQRHLVFRDYLRAHPGDVTAFANLKRALAVKFSADREAYTRAKSEFVEEILLRAHR